MKSTIARMFALMVAMFLLASCSGGGSGVAATPAAPATGTTLAWDQGNWDAVKWQ